MTRLGMIARADDTGLGNQTWEFHRHMKPVKTLIVDMSQHKPNGIGTVHLERFEHGEIRLCSFPPHSADVKWLLDDIDTVFTAETGYHPRFFQMCQQYNVKSVLQYNYEFYDQSQFAPTVLAAPTVWCADKTAQQSILLPVPIATDRWNQESDPTIPPTFLHIAGKPAVHDRNGTETFVAALAKLTGQTKVEIYCQDPDYINSVIWKYKMADGIDIKVISTNVENYWDMYQPNRILVMPRRFGGLCLEKDTPVRTTCGLKPIKDICVGDILLDANGPTLVTGKCERTVKSHAEIKTRGLSLKSSLDHLHMVGDGQGGFTPKRACEVTSADTLLIVKPESSGISTVKMPPKPKRQGLTFWPGKIELTPEWARLIGLWLAEGNRGHYSGGKSGRAIKTTSTVVWNFGPEYEYLADEVVATLGSAGIHATKRLSKISDATFGPSQCWIVRCRTLWLNELFDQLGLGHGAFGKKVPDVAAELVPGVVGGWLDGDGCQHKGNITGYSRSQALIKGMWRLCAKAGVLGSISHGGERLDIGVNSYARKVASWTTRMCVPKNDSKKQQLQFTETSNGWEVKIKSALKKPSSLEVVSIETTSEQYIANDILTHNCLPIQEAIGAGLPVIAPDNSPHPMWMPVMSLVRATKVGGFTAAGSTIDLYDTDPIELAGRMTAFTNVDLYSRLLDMNKTIKQQFSWESLKPIYDRFM